MSAHQRAMPKPVPTYQCGAFGLNVSVAVVRDFRSLYLVAIRRGRGALQAQQQASWRVSSEPDHVTNPLPGTIRDGSCRPYPSALSDQTANRQQKRTNDRVLTTTRGCLAAGDEYVLYVP